MTRRESGLIMYRFTERGERRTVYGRTPDDCYAARYAPEPEVVTIDDSTTLAAYLEIWCAGLDLRPNTIAGHRDNIARYLVPLFGDRLRLADLTRELARLKMAELRTYTTRSGHQIAPRTVALAFATLRAALNAAVNDHRLDYNPVARLNPNGATGSANRARRVGVEIVIPTELELRRVIRATIGEEWHLLLKLSAATGLRQSELLGLEVADLEQAIDTRWMHVHRALRRSDRVIDDNKNASSARFVPISSRWSRSSARTSPSKSAASSSPGRAGGTLTGSHSRRRPAGRSWARRSLTGSPTRASGPGSVARSGGTICATSTPRTSSPVGSRSRR